MKESNYKKLIDAGFRVLRLSLNGYDIRELQLTNFGISWSVLKSFKTKKACSEAFAELMKSDKSLEV